MLSFKSTFSLSTFTFIKRLFSSSSLSAIKVVSSAYLRLLIFLPAILIPACVSSSPAFLMMYSAYKLNKQRYPWGNVNHEIRYQGSKYSLPKREVVLCGFCHCVGTMYWFGQKIHLGFLVRWYRKT